MNIKFKNKTIELKKELSDLDKFVIKFTKVINKLNINYVIISGYIALLFGRSRGTEDIDIFIEKISKEEYYELIKTLEDNNFWCINTEDKQEQFSMLQDNLAIRIANKKEAIPNIEIKFPKDQHGEDSLDNKLTIKLNNHIFYTSPIESQIAFKLYLGSPKDIEDAIHLLNIFKKQLNKNLLKQYAKKLNVTNLMEKYKIG